MGCPITARLTVKMARYTGLPTPQQLKYEEINMPDRPMRDEPLTTGPKTDDVYNSAIDDVLKLME